MILYHITNLESKTQNIKQILYIKSNRQYVFLKHNVTLFSFKANKHSDYMFHNFYSSFTVSFIRFKTVIVYIKNVQWDILVFK